MTRIDPRFEAARQTNAAPCRGWDFSPSPAPRRNMLAIIASAAIVGIALLVSCVGVVS